MLTIPTDSLVEARNLAVRFQKGTAFRAYVRERLPLVVPALVVFAVLVMASVAATTALLARSYSLLVLPAFLLAPFLLVGSSCVAAYLFFAWLEVRALRRSLTHAPQAGAFPRVPWALVAVFLGLPLLALVIAWWKVGLPLAALGVATPFVFAHFDRS